MGAGGLSPPPGPPHFNHCAESRTTVDRGATLGVVRLRAHLISSYACTETDVGNACRAAHCLTSSHSGEPHRRRSPADLESLAIHTPTV